MSIKLYFNLVMSQGPLYAMTLFVQVYNGNRRILKDVSWGPTLPETVKLD